MMKLQKKLIIWKDSKRNNNGEDENQIW